MFEHNTLAIDPNTLRAGSLSVTPIQVEEWDNDKMWNDEWSYFEAVNSDNLTAPDGETPLVVVVRNGNVVGLHIPGQQTYGRDDWSDYENAHERYVNDDPNDYRTELIDGALDENQFDDVFVSGREGDDAEGPVMNYWYPCASITSDDSAVEAAVAIRDLPLVVVEVGGTYGLVLAGGGQDFTWEIVEAFVRLGQLPPVHYAGDLPAIAGRGNTDVDIILTRACRLALTEMIDLLTRQQKDLNHRKSMWMRNSA